MICCKCGVTRVGCVVSDSLEPLVSGVPDSLTNGRFTGRDAFEQLIRTALARAAHEGWQEIVLSDTTFEDWPLRERVVAEYLYAWSASGRRMLVLASRFDEVIRHQARFVAWRKTWGHIIDCRVCHVAARTDFPSVIWTSGWFMQRVDVQRSSGVCGFDREQGLQIKETLDELLRNSSPGFQTSTLGL